MRNFWMAVLIIGLPALAIGAFLLYGPQFYDRMIRDDVSPLDRKFSTVIGDQVVVGKMDDYSILDTVTKNGGSNSSASDNQMSRSAQVKAANRGAQENYYHDVQIDEVVNRNTEFYDLNASNPDELRKAILENAPTNADSGRHSISKMSYGVDWNLDTIQENGECKLLGVKVVTNITMLMPRWNGVANMGIDAQRAWSDYLSSVASYGERHNKIMEGVSRQIAERIRFVKKRALCSDLIADVNQIGTVMLSDARDRVKRYRSETGAGRQMGVRLPVFADSDLATNQEMAVALNPEFSEVATKPVVVAQEVSAETEKEAVTTKATEVSAVVNEKAATNEAKLTTKQAATHEPLVAPKNVATELPKMVVPDVTATTKPVETSKK